MISLEIELNYFNISTEKLQNYEYTYTLDTIFSGN